MTEGNERPISPMIPPSRLREPTPKREVDGKKIAYAASLVASLGGLVLIAIFLSWKIALAGALLEIGAVTFFMTIIVEAADAVRGGKRN